MIAAVLFVLGLVLLLGGGEILVRGAARLAVAMGIAPVVVGLTVVAFATSAPELAIGIQGVRAGQADLVVGNVVGSNIANLMLILGLSAAISVLVVDQKLIRVDVPLMVAVSAGVWVLAVDGRVGRGEGGLLCAGIVAYVVAAVRASRRAHPRVADADADAYGEPLAAGPGAWRGSLARVAAGVAALVLGARWLVEGATAAARALGVSELVIGLTIVALGTSLPELTTSVVATLRGERDIAAGNVIGSNIFNLLSVLGLTALVSPHGVAVSPAVAAFDLPVMVAASIACLPIFFVGNRISRLEGGLFLVYYAVYVAYLAVDAAGHDALTALNQAVWWFVVPLSAVTLLVLWHRQLKAASRAGRVPPHAPTPVRRPGSPEPNPPGDTTMVIDPTPVSALMNTRLVTVEPGDSLGTALARMTEARVHRLPVVETTGGDTVLVGIISDRDVRLAADSPYTGDAPEVIVARLHDIRVATVMTPVERVVSVSPMTLVPAAAELMLAHRIGGLPVVEIEGHRPFLVGILTRSDLIAHLIRLETAPDAT